MFLCSCIWKITRFFNHKFYICSSNFSPSCEYWYYCFEISAVHASLWTWTSAKHSKTDISLKHKNPNATQISEWQKINLFFHVIIENIFYSTFYLLNRKWATCNNGSRTRKIKTLYKMKNICVDLSRPELLSRRDSQPNQDCCRHKWNATNCCQM